MFPATRVRTAVLDGLGTGLVLMLWGRPPVLWPSFLFLPGDLSKLTGQPSSGCTRAVASVLTSQEPRAPPSVQMHRRDPRCSEPWAAPPSVHVKAQGGDPLWFTS